MLPILSGCDNFEFYRGKTTMFFFIFYYVMAAFVYFCHTAIITAKCAIHLSSQMHLIEEEKNQLFINYFAKILFQTVMMTVFPVSFWLYILISTCFPDILFVSSGLFTVIWLMITGILIKLVYYLVTHYVGALKVFDYDNFFQNKEIFWVMCPMLYGILFNLYDNTMFFIILAIVLGKYIWMDSFQVVLLSDIKIKVKEFFNNSKSDILLLFCQAIVMGYLLVRWYGIKDESINIEYTISTFLLVALFLMPIIDLFIFLSMKSYSKFIRK